MSLPPRGRRGRGGQDGHDPRARIRTRERRTMDLTVLGWSQHQIAADLGVTQAAVSKILDRVERRALRELTATVERHKARHTLRRAGHQVLEVNRDDRRTRRIAGKSDTVDVETAARSR